MRYHYIVVRNDLSPGVAAAMVGHAAGESFADSMQSAPVRGPVKGVEASGLDTFDPVTIIVLEASPRKLKALRKKLDDMPRGHRRVDFHEPDAPWRGALMSIGFWPMFGRSNNIVQLLSDLPLYAATTPMRRSVPAKHEHRWVRLGTKANRVGSWKECQVCHAKKRA